MDGRAAGQGQGAERRSEARETKQMEMEDSSSQPTAPSMGEAAGTRIVLLVAVPKNGGS